MVPLVNIMLSEVIFGGVGAGMYGMLIYIVLAVFIAGLMVGRTPEYLGKKIESYDVKMAMLDVLVSLSSFWCLLLSRCCHRTWDLSSLTNNGPHGLSEILYLPSTHLAAGNNGSAFAGLSANTHWYNAEPWIHHARRPFPNDGANDRARRQFSAKEERATITWNVPGQLPGCLPSC